jgi:hypothetical protein
MHAVGYVEYTVKYTQKVLFVKTTKTVTEKFVVVNNGWDDATTDTNNKQYSYYPEELITNTILNNPFRLTKIVNS